MPLHDWDYDEYKRIYLLSVVWILSYVITGLK